MRETGNDCIRNPNRFETGSRERDVQSGLGRWLKRNRARYRSRAQPGFRRSRVFDVHEDIGRAGHLTITKANQSLHIGVIQFAHSSETHSRTSLSVMDDFSKPWRMLVFL